MKSRIVLCMICVLFISSSIVSSQGTYLKAGAGYNFDLPKDYVGYNYTGTYYSSTNNSQKYSYTYGTYGKGTEINATLGYKGEYTGFEINASYKFKSTRELQSTDYDYSSSPTAVTNSIDSYETKLFTIDPCILFTTRNGLYGRIGLVFGSPDLTVNTNSQNGINITQRTITYSDNFATGYTGALGIDFGGEVYNFFIEATIVSLTWAPSSSEVTEYKVNGVDQLGTLTISQKKTNFESTYDSQTTLNSDQPGIAQKTYLPLNSVGLRAGIAIGF